MHLPINHRFRPFYRLLAALAGAYLLAFGVIGVMRTSGEPFFSREDTVALGLRTNPAFAYLSVAVGAVVLTGALLGKNIDHYINLFGGLVFWLAGLVMLLLLQTSANYLNFQVATCVVSFLIGTVLVLAGMYGKTGSNQAAQAEETFRHSGRGAVARVATPGHRVSAHPGVTHENL